MAGNSLLLVSMKRNGLMVYVYEMLVEFVSEIVLSTNACFSVEKITVSLITHVLLGFKFKMHVLTQLAICMCAEQMLMFVSVHTLTFLSAHSLCRVLP